MSGAFAQVRTATRTLASAQWSPVIALSGVPDWLIDARRIVARLSDLPEGWDGEGGPPLQRPAITSALDLLEVLEPYSELPPAHIGPTIGGGLGIEWHNGSRELDLEFLPDGTIEFLKTNIISTGRGVDEMEDGQIPLDKLKEVRRLVRWLMTGV